MKEYRSEIFECLHEDFKTHLKYGGITQAEMDEFERDAFKEVPDTPAPRPAHKPALAAGDPRSRASLDVKPQNFRGFFVKKGGETEKNS
jgi:hypothetical protein